MNKGLGIVFLYPITRMASSRVRGDLIINHIPNFLGEVSSVRFDSVYMHRFLKRFLKMSCFYLVVLRLYLLRKKVIVYLIKPDSIFELILLKIVPVRLVVDVNDPLHLEDFLGVRKFSVLVRFADMICFESEVYRTWVLKHFRLRESKTFCVEDSIPVSLCCADQKYPMLVKSFCWIGASSSWRRLSQRYDIFLSLLGMGWQFRVVGPLEHEVKQVFPSSFEGQISVSEMSEPMIKDALTNSVLHICPSVGSPVEALRGDLKFKLGFVAGLWVLADNLPMYERYKSEAGVLLTDLSLPKVALNREVAEFIESATYSLGKIERINEWLPRRQAWHLFLEMIARESLANQ